MPISLSGAQKAAYLFLALCCGALLSIVCWYVFDVYGPSKIVVGNVPYGLPSGSTIVIGDSPDLVSDMSKQPPQIQTELRRATELFRSGALSSAAEIFEGVAVVHPDLLPAVLGEINTLYEIDSLADVQKERLMMLSNKLQKKYPETGLSAYLESRSFAMIGNEAAALELARSASEKAPSFVDARLWFAEILMRNSRLIQAKNELHAVISLSNGDHPKAYELLAEVYHLEGLLDSCSAVVEYALSQYPVDAKLLLLLGYMKEYQGRFDDAEKIYQRILAFRPEYTPASEAVASLGAKSPPGTGNGVVL